MPRQAPLFAAKCYETGTRKKGLSGNMYVVKLDINGNKRWQKATNIKNKNIIRTKQRSNMKRLYCSRTRTYATVPVTYARPVSQRIIFYDKSYKQFRRFLPFDSIDKRNNPGLLGYTDWHPAELIPDLVNTQGYVVYVVPELPMWVD